MLIIRCPLVINGTWYTYKKEDNSAGHIKKKEKIKNSGFKVTKF